MRVGFSVCFLTFGALFTSGLLAGPTARSGTEELTAAVRGRLDAFNRRDIPAFEAYFATEYVGVDEDAAVSVVPPDYRALPRDYGQVHDLRDFVVRIHGDTAIVVYRTTEDEPFDGLVLTTEERRNETWQLQHGHWRLLMAHRAGIPVQRRATIPLDAHLLPNYAGTYQLRANENMFVTVDAAHLFLTFNLDVPPWQASYAGGDRFFFAEPEGDPHIYEFERDSQGHVVALIQHRPDGQDVRARKVH